MPDLNRTDSIRLDGTLRSAVEAGGQPGPDRRTPVSAVPERSRAAAAPARGWNQERVERLLAGYFAGRTHADIARDLGVTVDAVSRYLSHLRKKTGLPYRKLDDARRAERAAKIAESLASAKFDVPAGYPRTEKEFGERIAALGGFENVKEPAFNFARAKAFAAQLARGLVTSSYASSASYACAQLGDGAFDSF